MRRRSRDSRRSKPTATRAAGALTLACFTGPNTSIDYQSVNHARLTRCVPLIGTPPTDGQAGQHGAAEFDSRTTGGRDPKGGWVGSGHDVCESIRVGHEAYIYIYQTGRVFGCSGRRGRDSCRWCWCCIEGMSGLIDLWSRRRSRGGRRPCVCVWLMRQPPIHLTRAQTAGPHCP